MTPRSKATPLQRFPDALDRAERAKRRIIVRLSELSLADLRKHSSQASLLTWAEIIEVFGLRAKVRVAKEGRCARHFMALGLNFGRYLDRVLAKFRRG